MNTRKLSNFILLDCTLRDGGYHNEWNFEKYFVEKLLIASTGASIDIFEVGYLHPQKKNLSL